ncbi:hypothetical protein M0R45_037807 [Rubus argutus]|uniref:Uncharacterized protein n=1 Tax=Rubus argutus TaxID=59490 RepID=A0AAW1W0L4_RUBAR
MAVGARCGVRSGGGGGGGLRSSGGKSSSNAPKPAFFGRKSMSNTPLSGGSPSEQQDELLKTYPGMAYVVTVPPDGNYPFSRCQRYLDYFYDATRLCGSDCLHSITRRSFLHRVCGIEVSLDELELGLELEKKGFTSTKAPATVLTRSQRQDNLVKMYPGTAKVIRRPKTNPDGSEIVTRSDYEFPDVRCELHMQNLYQALRLCGRDYGGFVRRYHEQLQTFCGIEVDLDAMEKHSATCPNSVQQ